MQRLEISDPRRHHRSFGAGASAGGRRALRSGSVAGRANEEPADTADPLSHRRLRRCGRPRAPSPRRRHRGADRRHTSFRRADVRSCHGSGARGRGAAAGGLPAPVAGRPRRSLDDSVSDIAAAAAALGDASRRVFLTIGQKDLAPFRARSAAFLCDPQRRCARSWSGATPGRADCPAWPLRRGG